MTESRDINAKLAALIGATNDEFLEAVAGRMPPLVRPMVASFKGDPRNIEKSAWSGKAWSFGDRALPADHNNYFSIAAFNPDASGSYRRRKVQFKALCAIVLDDVGTKIDSDRVTLPPSWTLETSSENYQFGYILAEPLQDTATADQLQKAIIAAELCDPGADGPTARLARLPVGVNGKYDPPFQCRMVMWAPEHRYTVQQIIAGLRLDMNVGRSKPTRGKTRQNGMAMPPLIIQRKPSAALKKYAQDGLNNECAELSSAMPGYQESSLCNAALKMGAYVGASLLDFEETRAALVDAGMNMQNEAGKPAWTRDEIFEKVDAKLRVGVTRPKWGARPGRDETDDIAPLDIFGDTSLTGSPDFPLDTLPTALRRVVTDKAERLGVDPGMIAMPALVVCAAALDDYHRIQPKQHDEEWTESARLWVGIVEEAGGKKTPAINAAVAPLQEIELKWSRNDSPKQADYKIEELIYQGKVKKYIADLSKGNEHMKPIAPAKPPVRRLLVSDTTTEALSEILCENPAGLLSIYDELAQLIGSFDAYRTGKGGASKDRALYLQLYNGGPQPVDRVSRGRVEVPNWSTCIVGGIQPGVLRKLVGSLTEDGLLQRFIIIHGKQAGPGVDRKVDAAAAVRYQEIVEKLTTWRPGCRVVVRLSDEAQSVRAKFVERVEAIKVLPNTCGAFRSHLAKWDALFARIALTFHAIEAADNILEGNVPPAVFETMPNEVSGELAGRVSRLMLDYLLPNAATFYGETFGRGESASHARWVAGHILAQCLPVISARDIGRAYRALRDDIGELQRTMRILESAGWVAPLNGETKEYPRLWWVDPRVHQLFEAQAEKEQDRRAQERQKIQDATKIVKSMRESASAGNGE